MFEQEDPKAIWTEDEIPREEVLKAKAGKELGDSRPEPEYEIKYKQDVMAQDMFLGMGGKTPGSQVRPPASLHCPALVGRSASSNEANHPRVSLAVLSF